MNGRCNNPLDKNYSAYGGRGITVCDRWRESFEAFLADMGLAPSQQHSVDRWPNNDGNYEPGNCRWATNSEQRLNTRRSGRLLTLDERQVSIREVAAYLAMNQSTLRRYLIRAEVLQ
jgi:hypothetical protein